VEVRVCPRCGLPYRSIGTRSSGGRVYYYAYHGRDGEKVLRCHLGPETYEYATVTHAREGLLLHGAVQEGRTLSYLRALLDFIVRSGNTGLMRSAISEMEAYLERLKREVAMREKMEEDGLG